MCKWVDANRAKLHTPIMPPADLAEVAEGAKADLEQGRDGRPTGPDGKWSRISARDRGKICYKISQLGERNTDEGGAGNSRQRQADKEYLRRLPQVAETLNTCRLGDEER